MRRQEAAGIDLRIFVISDSIEPSSARTEKGMESWVVCVPGWC